MSRTRLDAIIKRAIRPNDRERVLSPTMAYESAADETVFIVGPLLVGLLFTAVAPWLAIAGASLLTLVFVNRIALHPTGGSTLAPMAPTSTRPPPESSSADRS